MGRSRIFSKIPMSKSWTWIVPYYLGHFVCALSRHLNEQPRLAPICLGPESAAQWASCHSIGCRPPLARHPLGPRPCSLSANLKQWSRIKPSPQPSRPKFRTQTTGNPPHGARDPLNPYLNSAGFPKRSLPTLEGMAYAIFGDCANDDLGV